MKLCFFALHIEHRFYKIKNYMYFTKFTIDVINLFNEIIMESALTYKKNPQNNNE